MIQDNTITREDFEKSARLNDLEVFTEQEVKAWLGDNKKLIEKSEVDELDEIEKGELNDFMIDSKSLNRVIVIENDLTKSVMFYRPSQVKWDKDEEGNLMKARSGVYKDTPYNRKKGIVGMRFGQTKGAKKGTEEKGKDMKKPTMNNLDWGKTTEERNSNLDKYESLKTEDEKVKFLNELKGKPEVGEKKEGKEEKENKGGEDSSKETVKELKTLSPDKPLDSQLKELTGDGFEIGKFHNEGSKPDSLLRPTGVLVHDKTGKKFKIPPKN